MILIHDWQLFPSSLGRGVLSIGNFDGVHKGHEAMLHRAKSEAAARRCPLTIMTFDPHPASILRPDIPRKPLTTTEQRIELIRALEPDALVVLKPTPEFLALSADDFLTTVLRDTLAPQLLVEGPTFNFGFKARGTVPMLQDRGPSLGFDVLIPPIHRVELVDETMVDVSSSMIRNLVSLGRMSDVTRALGRPYTLRGEIVHGAKRGRTIGFPTANLATAQLLPAPGVYAGRALIDNTPHRAAISIGTNPTFNGTLTTVEAYLLDFNANLYGKTLDLQFHHYLRDMQKFDGLNPLLQQMHLDVTRTRELIP